MERQRYLQWTVSETDAQNSHLGYEVRLSKDRYLSKVLSSENSFSRPDLFLLNGSTYPSGGAHYPVAGSMVSYSLSSQLALTLPIVANGTKIYQMNSLGHLINSIDLGVKINFLSIDQKTNDIWVTTSGGAVLRLRHDFTAVPSVPSPSDTLALLIDGARNRYWLIRKGIVSLISLSEGVLLSVSLAINGVSDAVIDGFTGNLFIAGTTSLFFINTSGVTDTQTGSFIGLSSWGLNNALCVKGDNSIYNYDGASLTTLCTFAGPRQLSSVTGLFEKSIYLFDTYVNNLLRVDPLSYEILWAQMVFLDTPMFARVLSTVDSNDNNRRIYCVSPHALVSVEDSGIDRSLGMTDWKQKEGSVFAGLTSPFPAAHVWSDIISISHAPSSSSSSSQSSSTFIRTTSSSSSSSTLMKTTSSSSSSPSSSTIIKTTSSSSSTSSKSSRGGPAGQWWRRVGATTEFLAMVGNSASGWVCHGTPVSGSIIWGSGSGAGSSFYNSSTHTTYDLVDLFSATLLNGGLNIEGTAILSVSSNPGQTLSIEFFWIS